MKKKATIYMFTLAFVILSSYILLVKSELYQSETALVVRDLSSNTPSASLGLSLLSNAPNSQLQDSMVVEEYILSLDMFLKLDKEFNLRKHYQSNEVDLIERLAVNEKQENILEFYRSRTHVSYNDISGILHIAYAHTDAIQAKKILEEIILKVEFALNEFNRKKAKKQLSFIEIEHKKNKDKLNKSSRILEEYQNRHLLLDPENKATSSTAMIANLEATLTQKKIELSTKKSYLNNENYEVQALKSEISEITNSLLNKKKGLAGTGKTRLNKVLFEYERLKMQLEFDTEVYKNALVQLETIKLDALKEAKTLSVVSKPNLPDGYTYPDKPRELITLLIIMLLSYGIFSMLQLIIKDHKE